ncbi:MAG: hypothetical protein JWQ20_4563, partial [Conexibacter sp.]|nr:hypothetical protein [Conexibacter sp.]
LRAASASDPAARDSADVTNRASGAAGPGVFPIGVWSQPKRSFDTWKARGINTMVQYEGAAATIDEWTQAAVDRGLYMIRRPRPNPADDVGQLNLIAWAHPDEPDIVSTHHPAPFIAAEYARWKAADPDMPVWVNFSGGYVNHWQGNLGRADYQAFLDATDWVSSSIYPVNGWDRPGDLDGPGKAVDRLEQWSGGKPQFAVIEAADQQLYWMPKDVPGPTPGQFRAEIWDAIVRGARGIIYFPQSFKPGFSYDNAAPDIVAEMQAQNARIAALGDVLLGPGDPPGLGIDAAAPLVATWRFHKGRAYFVVLNRSDQTLAAQTLRLHGTGRSKSAAVDGERRTVAVNNGVIRDDFAPYETHVYAVG